MSAVTAIAGAVTLVTGAALILGGLVFVEAGRCRRGPFPFLRLPIEWDMVAIGAAAALLGAVLAAVGIEVML